MLWLPPSVMYIAQGTPAVARESIKIKYLSIYQYFFSSQLQICNICFYVILLKN